MLTINLEDDLEALLNSIADKTHSQPEQVVKELIRHYAENLASFDNDFFD
jgi:predicted transcriptional regulator